ncbi:transporter substrate-binding domain-containing protein [Terasakiella sp. A23]|uniref:substrate-binding periplasmic protein n=1 Tax=Terasakiella sp. FCG-A23 TaxID=3080561 RepID=UPI002954686B|nr:transporter substrate-binding domain-containing protein [Terasakiella sp. A23]MDV7339684.1 transporter substrate-binding domain-containing protein [Terasakiella sp. A23]
MRLLFIFVLMLSSLTFSKVEAGPDFSKIKVITSFYEPYSYLENGSAQGVAVNQARKILAELKFYPDIKVYPWARAYTIATNQPNTALFSVARTPEREDLFHWIGEIVDFDVYLFRLKKRDDINLTQLADARNYKIATLAKDVKGEYLRKNQIKTTPITNEETGIRMILSNRIDLLPTDLDSMTHRLEKLNLPSDALVPALHLKEISRPLYFALSKDTPPEIVAAFKAAYKRAFP